MFHVSLLKPAVPDPFPDRGTRVPEPVLVDASEEYEVEAILDCRRRLGQVQFLIKWKGYGPENNSWEPDSNIHAKRLICAYFSAHPEKKSYLGIRRLPVERGQCQRRAGTFQGNMRARMRTRGLSRVMQQNLPTGVHQCAPHAHARVHMRVCARGR